MKITKSTGTIILSAILLLSSCNFEELFGDDAEQEPQNSLETETEKTPPIEGSSSMLLSNKVDSSDYTLTINDGNYLQAIDTAYYAREETFRNFSIITNGTSTTLSDELTDPNLSITQYDCPISGSFTFTIIRDNDETLKSASAMTDNCFIDSGELVLISTTDDNGDQRGYSKITMNDGEEIELDRATVLEKSSDSGYLAIAEALVTSSVLGTYFMRIESIEIEEQTEVFYGANNTYAKLISIDDFDEFDIACAHTYEVNSVNYSTNECVTN